MTRLTLLALLLVADASAATAKTFRDAAVGDQVVVNGLRLGPQKNISGEIVLERIEIYAPGARIWVPNSRGGHDEVPRNADHYFIRKDGSLGNAFFIATSPDGTQFRGVMQSSDGTREFRGTVDRQSLRVESVRLLKSVETKTSCGLGDDEVHAAGKLAAEHPASPGKVDGIGKTSAGSLHQAVVAVDTNNEFMLDKFSNNTTNATNYLSDLFAGMNVMYERDLDVRLVQGDTFLRVSGTTDPYTACDATLPGSCSTSDEMDEVSEYWMNTPEHQAVDRAFVTFLSGKGPNDFGSSGIAWLVTSGNFCTSTGQVFLGRVFGHYSAIQVFKFTNAASVDVSTVGHEIGHNFGANHTHCTSIINGSQPVAINTIDQCYNGEAVLGCYAGTPACPNDNSVPNQGSVMSYCHLGGANGASCPGNGGNTLLEFHPAHIGVLDQRVTTNIGNGCFTAVGGGGDNDIFADGFE